MKLKRISILLLFLSAIVTHAADAIDLDESTRAHCLKVLRVGLMSDEFWPSMQAVEGLTMGGYGGEVRVFFAARLETEKDNQHRCGLARELVRAGDEKKRNSMLDILRWGIALGRWHFREI